MVDFAIDYDVLHAAKKELHSLADRTGPKFRDKAFDGLGDYGANNDEVFGDFGLSSAFSTLYYRSKGPLEKAEKDLRKLGDIFSAVADAFFNMDAQIADGCGFRGSDVGYDDWREKYDAWLKHDEWQKKKNLWDQHEQHGDSCVPGDKNAPEYCGATDPGPEPKDPGKPPTSHTIETPDGTVKTELTLDDDKNVKTETTTITTSNGKTYETVTTFRDKTGDSYTTVTTYADGSKATADVVIKRDGEGNMTDGSKMTVTDDKGKKTEYVPDGKKGWKEA
ncbi:hypothetical protein GCM10022254_41550 [Actinomadura meridiana]|uniref:Uncharacterized protein n=1 Tax=Actinomadura meridiana TaxID=559626 RepID=A0ABP8C7P9_9ACTN